jgi:hypothetical protein
MNGPLKKGNSFLLLTTSLGLSENIHRIFKQFSANAKDFAALAGEDSASYSKK